MQHLINTGALATIKVEQTDTVFRNGCLFSVLKHMKRINLINDYNPLT